MQGLDKDRAKLPPHIADTVEAIASVHAEHYERTTCLQRIARTATAIVGAPLFAVILSIFVVAWVAGNLTVIWAGRQPWDPPPFPYLAGFASLLALYTTVMILVTQRHDDEIERHREQLTLEIAILSEQKSAKIIRMLEQMRNDSPHLANSSDQEVAMMSDAADPHVILNAIKEAHQQPR